MDKTEIELNNKPKANVAKRLFQKVWHLYWFYPTYIRNYRTVSCKYKFTIYLFKICKNTYN